MNTLAAVRLALLFAILVVVGLIMYGCAAPAHDDGMTDSAALSREAGRIMKQ